MGAEYPNFRRAQRGADRRNTPRKGRGGGHVKEAMLAVTVMVLAWNYAPQFGAVWTVATNSPEEIHAREQSRYFSGCDEARAAGAAPIYRGQPGYRDKMDGDSDGIACEPYRGS